jgi:ElaB/YqjD/DUF883 family membrane-anchored ribosome-binding protein
MTKLNDVRPSMKNDGHRNTDAIRQDIAQAEQEMSQTVERIGNRINKKLDWQEYVRETPYLALGVAASVGYLASKMFVKKRSPMDRVLDAVADELRDAAGGIVAKTAGPGLVKATLLGIASKAAVGWLQNAAFKDTAARENNVHPDSKCCATDQTPGIDRESVV